MTVPKRQILCCLLLATPLLAAKNSAKQLRHKGTGQKARAQRQLDQGDDYYEDDVWVYYDDQTDDYAWGDDANWVYYDDWVAPETTGSHEAIPHPEPAAWQEPVAGSWDPPSAEEDDLHYEDPYTEIPDNYYQYKGGKKSGKKGSKKSKKGGAIGRPTVSITGTAFGPKSHVAVLTAPDASPFDAGTQYPFDDWAASVNNVEDAGIYINIGGRTDGPFNVYVDGICTRLTESAAGSCNFAWNVYDPNTDGAFVGGFIGQGVMPHEGRGSMVVTGGSGLFTGLYGVAEVGPAKLGEGSPPVVESEPKGLDVFEEVDGYLHVFFLVADQEFLES